MSERRRTTPYQRIMRAMRRGTGCRLSFDDVVELSCDSAIEARAEMDDEGIDDPYDTPTKESHE